MTAIKTDRAIRKALDGVLFHRRGLVRSRGPANYRGADFGAEAIETLLKRMEDYRHRLIVIVAGYPRLMHDFDSTRTPPALRAARAKSRAFPDLTRPTRLVAIAERFAGQNEYRVTEPAQGELRRDTF
mgnify:CR=1 FL=1